MNREKFDRNKSYVNIGEIGRNESIDANRMALTSYAIDFITSNSKDYNQNILENLISQYGEDEGKRRFEILKQAAEERYKTFKEIGVELENKTSGRSK